MKKLTPIERAEKEIKEYGGIWKKLTPIEQAEKSIKQQGGIWGEEGWVVKGDLDLWNFNLFTLPEIKFIGGYFNCGSNKLTSLTGSPKTVGGNFWCWNNLLKSLVGLPDKIGGKFYCNAGLSFPKEEILLLIKAHPGNLEEAIKKIKWI